MGKFKFAEQAFHLDHEDNEYTGQTLYLAMLLHCSGTGRTAENEKEVGRLLDDPNQKDKNEPRKGKQPANRKRQARRNNG